MTVRRRVGWMLQRILVGVVVAVVLMLLRQNLAHAATAPAFVGVAQNTGSAAATVQVLLPGGVIDGDSLLLYVQMVNTADTMSTPTGWTSFGSVSNSVSRAYLFTRTAASEPASTTFSKTGTSSGWRVTEVVYRGAGGIESVAANTGTGTTASCASGTTVSADTAQVVALGSFSGSTTATPDTGWTERLDVGASVSASVQVSDRTVATAGSSVACSITLSSSQSWILYSVVLLPYVAPATTTTSSPPTTIPAVTQEQFADQNDELGAYVLVLTLVTGFGVGVKLVAG